jgi:hypothetical protein
VTGVFPGAAALFASFFQFVKILVIGANHLLPVTFLWSIATAWIAVCERSLFLSAQAIPWSFIIKHQVMYNGKTTQTKESLTVENQLSLLHRALDREPAKQLTGQRIGQEVEMQDALDCIGLYPGAMYNCGLRSTAGQVIQGPIVSRLITTSEDFTGDGLLDWMMRMIQNLTNIGMGTDITFGLHLGIYTEPFLTKYVADQGLRSRLHERITIFIIPRGFAPLKLLDGDDITAFELGGVQP